MLTATIRPASVPPAVMLVQGALLITIGAVGLVWVLTSAGLSATAEVQIAWVPLNWPHSLVLLTAGLLSLSATRSTRTLLWWSAVQLVGFGVFYWFGTASSINQPKTATPFLLDPAELGLHVILVVIALAVLMTTMSLRETASRPAEVDHDPKAHRP